MREQKIIRINVSLEESLHVRLITSWVDWRQIFDASV